MKNTVRLGALWLLAALLVAGSGASSLGYAVLLTERLASVSANDTGFWQLLNGLSMVTMPLLAAGLLTALIALATHAALWDRERATPPEP